MRFWRRQGGDTLVEVVFAIAILTTVLTAGYRMSTLSFKLGVDSREHTQAISFAQQQLESLRWYADNQMSLGNALLTPAGTPNLGACGYGVGCYMPAGAGAVPTPGVIDCSASVTNGCQAQFSAIDDIAIDTAVAGSAAPAKFPEIDEQVVITWPSTNQAKDTCLNGTNVCNRISFHLRIADTTAYKPLDCNVAGSPGCSIATTGPGAGCTPGAQMHINPPPGNLNEPKGVSTPLNFTVQNTPAGVFWYLVETPSNNQPKQAQKYTGSGCAMTAPWTFPGDVTWTVQACLQPTPSPGNCSDNSIVITPTIPVAQNCLNNPVVDPNDGISYVCGLLANYYNNDTASGGSQAKRWQTPTVWFQDIISPGNGSDPHTIKNVLCGGSDSCDVAHSSIIWAGQVKLAPGINTVCMQVDDGAEVWVGGAPVGGYSGPFKILFNTFTPPASIPSTQCGSYDNKLGFTWWFPIVAFYNNTCCSVTNGGYYGSAKMYLGGIIPVPIDDMSGLLRVPTSLIQNPNGSFLP